MNRVRSISLTVSRGVLWLLGILAYTWIAVRLSALAKPLGMVLTERFLIPLGYYAVEVLIVQGILIVLLALAMWQVFARRHKTAGIVLMHLVIFAILYTLWHIWQVLQVATPGIH